MNVLTMILIVVGMMVIGDWAIASHAGPISHIHSPYYASFEFYNLHR
jgi:hypothetical protein